MPSKYTPPRWEHNNYAPELWLQRAMQHRRWHPNGQSPDLIFFATNFSMWCIAGRMFAMKKLWGDIVKNPHFTDRAPKLLVAFSRACGKPWSPTGRRPPSFLTVRDNLDITGSGKIILADKQTGIVSPYVIAEPSWLVGGAPLPERLLQWDQRKLVFFAGHVPKLSVSTLRYSIWRNLRSDPRATVYSHTINCTVGVFSACRLSRGELDAMSNEELVVGWCEPFCTTAFAAAGGGPNGTIDVIGRFRPVSSTKTAATSRKKSRGCMQGLSTRNSKDANIRTLRSSCKLHTGVNYTDELADMARTTRRASHIMYARDALRHKFCIAAPGDFPSTPKIAEGVAFGGVGGCIPIFVVPFRQRVGRNSTRTDAMLRMLPYHRWLDYCAIGYLVDQAVLKSRGGSRAVLEQLSRVTADEAGKKYKALRRVRNAFVTRPDEGANAPDDTLSASHYILAEACAAARRHNRGQQQATPAQEDMAGGDPQRCLLHPGNDL